MGAEYPGPGVGGPKLDTLAAIPFKPNGHQLVVEGEREREKERKRR